MGDLRKQSFYLQTAVNEVEYNPVEVLINFFYYLESRRIVANPLFEVYKGIMLPISQIIECILIFRLLECLFLGSTEDILCKGQILIKTHLVSIFFNLISFTIENTKLLSFFTPFGNFCTVFKVKKI